MVWARRFWLRLQSLFRRDRITQRLDDEIQFHLDQQIAENIASGMSREDARYAATRNFGNPTFLKEATRDTWGWTRLEEITRDVKYACRALSRVPGFTAVAVLTLALGIGANTAVFTVVNGVLLRSMPFPESDRLFLISLTPRGGPFEWQPGVSDGDYLAFRDQDLAFEKIASFSRGTTATLTGAGDAVQIPVAYVTTDFFSLLRTSAGIGRGFLTGEGEPGNNTVTVLSDEL
jgi:macrolide transport system ATP-binding/permease protein